MSNTREYNNAVRQYWMNRENPQNNNTTKGILNFAKLGYHGNRAIKQSQKADIGYAFAERFSGKQYDNAPDWFKKLYSADDVANMMTPEFYEKFGQRDAGFFGTMKDAFMPSEESAMMQQIGGEAISMGEVAGAPGASGAGGAGGAGTGLGVAMGLLALGVGAGKKGSTFNRWANKLK